MEEKKTNQGMTTHLAQAVTASNEAAPCKSAHQLAYAKLVGAAMTGGSSTQEAWHKTGQLLLTAAGKPYRKP